jgi:hypothetical protein
MSARRTSHVALLLEDAAEETLWRGAFASQAMPAEALPMGADPDRLASDPCIARARAVIADAPALLACRVAPASFAELLARRFPGMPVFVRLPSRTGISASEQAWARRAGIASLLPGSTAAAWQDSLAPVLARVLAAIGGPALDGARLESYVNGLLRGGAEPRPGPVKDAYVDAFHLESAGVNANRLYDAMQADGGLAIADRTWRGKPYRECFVASQAIDWAVARHGLRRETALRACTFLWRTGRLHHVLREADFRDDFLFFRLSGRRAELDRVDLTAVEEAMRSARGGVELGERTYLSKTYARCFVGAEAVDWLMARHHLPLGAAETIGQRLLELGVFHHVLDQHGFVAGRFYYRFRADEAALLA